MTNDMTYDKWLSWESAISEILLLVPAVCFVILEGDKYGLDSTKKTQGQYYRSTKSRNMDNNKKNYSKTEQNFLICGIL